MFVCFCICCGSLNTGLKYWSFTVIAFITKCLRSSPSSAPEALVAWLGARAPCSLGGAAVSLPRAATARRAFCESVLVLCWTLLGRNSTWPVAAFSFDHGWKVAVLLHSSSSSSSSLSVVFSVAGEAGGFDAENFNQEKFLLFNYILQLWFLTKISWKRCLKTSELVFIYTETLGFC